MKKCLILFAVLIATLVISMLFENGGDDMPKDTLTVSEVDIENLELPNGLGE